jgi:hypothetical protein
MQEVRSLDWPRHNASEPDEVATAAAPTPPASVGAFSLGVAGIAGLAAPRAPWRTRATASAIPKAGTSVNREAVLCPRRLH